MTSTPRNSEPAGTTPLHRPPPKKKKKTVKEVIACKGVTITFDLDIIPACLCAISFNSRSMRCFFAGTIKKLRHQSVKARIHLLIQSCDPITRYGKPLERTNEIGPEMIPLVRATGAS